MKRSRPKGPKTLKGEEIARSMSATADWRAALLSTTRAAEYRGHREHVQDKYGAAAKTEARSPRVSECCSAAVSFCTMNPLRRTLLKAASLTPAAASAGLAHAGTSSWHQQKTHAPDTLLRSHFAPLKGEAFAFRKAGGIHATAILQLADPLPGADDGEVSFRLVFQAAEHQPLMQDTWEVFHPALGGHAIFVSPNDAAGREIEAVFNRHQPA